MKLFNLLCTRKFSTLHCSVYKTMIKSVTRHRSKNINILDFAKESREDGFFNDLTIIAGNKKIPANRLILSSQSKYFEGMFKSILADDKFIEIQAIECASISSLIDFIYNGFITINKQNVMSLFKGAEYLQLDEVKQFCFEFL